MQMSENVWFIGNWYDSCCADGSRLNDQLASREDSGVKVAVPMITFA